jgi:hypothetical protein
MEPTLLGLAFLLKLLAKSSSGTRICQRLSCTLERSVIPKPSGGLKICMHKMIQGDPFPEITLFTKGYILSISRI